MELQLENVIGCSVGVQSRHSGLTSPDETVLSTEDDDWTVDEFHQELLSLHCGREEWDNETHTSGTCFLAVHLKAIILPALSTVAAS